LISRCQRFAQTYRNTHTHTHTEVALKTIPATQGRLECG